MGYTIHRYHQCPTTVVTLKTTDDPGIAMALVRWARAAPDDGVVVTIVETPVIHCPPAPAASPLPK